MITRALIAEGRPIVRSVLRSLLDAEADVQIAGEVPTAWQAVELSRTLRPNVIVIDLPVPATNTLAAIAELCNPGNESQPIVIVLSMHCERQFVDQALQAGARAYVLKNHAFEELLPAIRAAMQGEIFISPALIENLVGERLGTAGAMPAAGETTGTPQPWVSSGEATHALRRTLVERMRSRIVAELTAHFQKTTQSGDRRIAILPEEKTC